MWSQTCGEPLVAAIGAGNPVMRTHMPTFAMIALVGFGSHADAQARCSELTKLRSEAAEAVKQMTGIRHRTAARHTLVFSLAWGDIVRYANDHRELCDISSATLSEFEKRYREAARTRDNVCASR